MKRFAFKLVVLLCAGAIVNVAMAWGCGRLWKPDWMFPQASGDDWAYRCVLAEYRIGPMLCELETGWPMASMHLSWIGGRQDARSMVFKVPNMPVGNTVTTVVEPLRPIWPGFAINTIFYAAILWMMFFAPGMVRHMVRRRRGLCPACAYPVGTSPACTECGRAIQGAVIQPRTGVGL